MDIPDNFRPLYSAERIRTEVRRVGVEISAWASEVWERSHSEILTIPILRGGIFFFADLVREIPRSVEIASARAWAYQDNVQGSKIRVNIQEVPARGRAVLLVDDICDSGKTLDAMTQALLGAGAQDVRSAVLIKRDLGKPGFEPNWSGFVYHGPEWLVGYGMDDCDRFRNLPGIHVIRQS